MDDAVTRTMTVTGDIDMTNAAAYAAQSRSLLVADGVQALVIDLGGVQFIDSQGLGFLIESRNFGLANGVEVRLRSLPPRVQKLLQISGLAPVFNYED